MKYRLFNGDNFTFNQNDTVPNLGYKGDAVVAIDPSKTNCAIVIGDPGGTIVAIIEASGNNWGSGKPIPTTQYCSELREFLMRVLRPMNVKKVGLEQAITKRGMEHHHSNMVLTEIRAALLGLFWDEYIMRKEEVEINNWTWKHAILPEGYRSQSEKGSKRYFREYLHDLTYEDYHEADVTDCLCIYKYLTRDSAKSYKIVCVQTEECTLDTSIVIMPAYADSMEFRKFQYNPSFSVDDNANYYANRSPVSGIAELPIDNLSLEEIYKYASGFNSLIFEGARLVVMVPGRVY